MKKTLNQILGAAIICVGIWGITDSTCYFLASRFNNIALDYKAKAIKCLATGKLVESKTNRDLYIRYGQKSEKLEKFADTINPIYHIFKAVK